MLKILPPLKNQKVSVLHLEEVCEGMVVANDIKNMEGELLLRRGQEISKNHLRLFRIWGIYRLEILTEQDEKKENLQEVPPFVLEQVRNLFIHNDLDHPAIHTLFICRLKQEQKTGYQKWATVHPEEAHPPSASSILWEIDLLPELPSILNKLNQVLNDYQSSSYDIAEVIKSSPSLATKILRFANSPFYGFRSKIETISRAITAVGTRGIGEIAVAVCILEHFKKINDEKLNTQSFFQHCILCGIIARIIATNKKMKNTERFFVYGLIHKIGRLILFSHFHDMAAYLLYKTSNEGEILSRVEKELGFNHAEIGGEIAKKWNFPPTLINSISHYLTPMNANPVIDAAILHLSDIITHSTGIGNSGEEKIPPLSSRAWSELEMDPTVLPVIIKQSFHQATPLFELFFNDH